MSDSIRSTIDDLTQKVAAEEMIVSGAIARMAPLKAAVNSLCTVLGQPEIYTLGEAGAQVTTKKAALTWRSDQFFNRPLAGAVVEYMEARDSAGMERPALVDEIYSALCQGGFKFQGVTGNESNHKRALAVSLAKNTAQFTKVGDKFALRKWYGMRASRKSADSGTGDDNSPPPEHIVRYRRETTEPLPEKGAEGDAPSA